MTTKKTMSGRERIIAALEHKPINRLPFTPCIDGYALLGLPSNLTGDPTLNIANPRRQIAALQNLGCDLLVRDIRAYQNRPGGGGHLQLCGEFISPAETSSEIKGTELREILKTPAGTLTGTWKFSGSGGTIPHFTKYIVNNYEELKLYDIALDYLNPQPPHPRYDLFSQYDKLLGDDGVPTISFSPSPFMFLIMFVLGLENTYLLLDEHRPEIESILAKIHNSQKRSMEVIAASPAKIVIIYENTSSTLLSPKYFRRYCLPHLNDYANILHKAGKILLIHMCGKLSAMANDFTEAKFDGICDIAPQPTGDFPLDEAKCKLPNKVVMGGIDATTFNSLDAEFVETKITDLIQRVKSFRGVLLGSGDAVPKDVRVENFRIIRRLIDTIGTYD